MEHSICPEDPYKLVKHADSYGRINLGRANAYKTYVVQEMTEGAILLRPAAIVERRNLPGPVEEIIRLPKDY